MGTSGLRVRNRRPIAVFLATLLAVALCLFGLGAAYELGLEQSRIEVERLAADVEAQHKLTRDFEWRVAVAERDAVRVAELKEMLENRADNLRELTPETLPLLDLVEDKLARGVSPDRLALFIKVATPERRCSPDLETKRFLLRTALERQGSTVSLSEGRFSMSGSGQDSFDGDGRLQAWFDAGQPVDISLLWSGGSRNLQGNLPLKTSVVQGRSEYLFEVTDSSRRGFAEVRVEVCEYP